MRYFLFIIALFIIAQNASNYLIGGYITHATVYDDLTVSPLAAKTPAADYPGFAEFPAGSQTFGYYFDAASDECVYFSLQLPHKYKEGTALHPHVHWAPTNTDTGDVVWQLDYTIKSMSGTYGASSQIYINDAGDGTALKHQVVSFSTISGSGLTISAIMFGKLCRDANGTNATDSYNADAVLLAFDLHIELDTLGSRSEGAK
jgi:hypothetical protein